jgi:UDP-MurNAc hydroxylase
MSKIDYLGHAGFVVEHRDTRILVDPWFFPAFLASWFPSPDNRFLLDRVRARKHQYLYVSQTHEDHFDRNVLTALDKNVIVLCPAFRSMALVKRLSFLGFTRIICLGHKESRELAPGLKVTMFLDTGHKEDSALLVDMDGYRFFDMNDCNTPLSELPKEIDLLAAQYSGAMWYPSCYDYPQPVMQKKVDRVRADLMDTLARKCKETGARTYVPSAGPACFLDPALWPYNDRRTTIFPLWEDVADSFHAGCPDTEVLRVLPGDAIHVEDRTPSVERLSGDRPDEDVASYSERRRPEWESFYTVPERPIAAEEVEKYFATLQRRNKLLVRDFSKHIRLEADGQTWNVRLGELAEEFVIEGEEPYEPEYELLTSGRVLRAILDGSVGWEEALLSLRIKLRRNPDVFDSRFLGLLRYGNEPAQTVQMVREINSTAMIERDGIRMQRFCPHMGEDMKHATVCSGVIECPRHHWKWDARTGECLEGGTLKLRIQAARKVTAGS